MANTVLTSKNRIIGLPVSIKELEQGEIVVATTAPLGLLAVLKKDGLEFLHDYSTINAEEAPPLKLPSIETYKTLKSDMLLKQLEDLQQLKENP